MAVRLPRLIDTQCVFLRACGEVRTKDRHLLKLLKEERDWTARYTAKSRTMFARLHTASATGKHLHVDCALRDYFPEKRTPKANYKKSDLTGLLSEFLDAELEIGVLGIFRLRFDELPETGLIRSLGSGRRTGDISVRMVRGELEISGAPIYAIGWEPCDDQGWTRVSLKGELTERVDEQYLTRVWKWIESQCTLFVKGKTKDDEPFVESPA